MQSYVSCINSRNNYYSHFQCIHSCAPNCSILHRPLGLVTGFDLLISTPKLRRSRRKSLVTGTGQLDLQLTLRLLLIYCIVYSPLFNFKFFKIISYQVCQAGLKNYDCWAGEMAQCLRALLALPKVLSLTPSNHMVAHNHL